MGRNLTTFQKARLQVVAYRSIQAKVSEMLAPHDMNVSQWIILGWLHDNPDGMRVTALAEMLQVETPLITALIQSLVAAKLVQTTTDPADKRAKQLRLTPEGQDKVEKLETELSERLRGLDKGIRKGSLDGYFRVLEQFIQNAEAMGEDG